MESSSQKNIILILDTLVFEEIIKTETRNKIIEELKIFSEQNARSYDETFKKFIENLPYEKSINSIMASPDIMYRSVSKYEKEFENKGIHYHVTIYQKVK
jgi:hypothetical protein